MIDWRNTVFERVAADRLELTRSRTDIMWSQMHEVFDALDAAGLLVTPERLNAIAETIEANKDDFVDGRACVALDCAAAIVRHSMPAVTT